MPTFSLSCLLPADLETCFQFHQDFDNLPRVQPGWAPVHELKPDGPPRVGTRIELSCGHLVRQQWVVEIAEVHPPSQDQRAAWSVDRAILSPFPHWNHTHHFERVGNSTRMTDRIEFSPPFRWFGILLLPGIYLTFFCLFLQRHLKTRKLIAHE
jgi:ligand-binding SRPBCC domain-containing protein